MSIVDVLQECDIAHIEGIYTFLDLTRGGTSTAQGESALPEEVHPLERYKLSLRYESNDEDDIFGPHSCVNVESIEFSDSLLPIFNSDSEQTRFDSSKPAPWKSVRTHDTGSCINETLSSKPKPLEEPQARSSHRKAHDLGDKRGVHRKRWNSSFQYSLVDISRELN